MPHLAPAARAILAALAEHPDSTVIELALLVGIHHATPQGILPKLERHGLVIRHPGRRGPGGGPDRWALADGVVAPLAPKPLARPRSGPTHTVRVDREVYQAILAHKHALEATCHRQLSMQEVIADAYWRWTGPANQHPSPKDGACSP